MRRVLMFLAELFGLRVERLPSRNEVESSALRQPVDENNAGVDATATVQPLSPEEQLIRDSMPPSAVAESLIVTRVGSRGQIPRRSEQTELTATGAALVRTEFLCADDFGVIGRPENLRGVCAICGRVSFQGRTCAVCGLFICPGCSGPFKEGSETIFLCRPHLRSAKWRQRIWPQSEQASDQGEEK